MKKFLLIVGLTFLTLILPGYPQAGFIPLNVDYAAFRGVRDSVYLEVYLSFYQNNLSYQPQEEGLEARFVIRARLRQGERVVAAAEREKISRIASTQDIVPGRQFVEVFGFLIPAGEYQLEVDVRDQTSGRVGQYVLEARATPFGNDSLQISDIELASHIVRGKDRTPFFKNNLQVVPNPNHLYGIGLPVLYYYAEVYNFQVQDDNPGEYQVRAYITGANGEVARQFPEKVHTKPGKSAVVVGGGNIIALPPGSYFLHLEVTDRQSGQTVRRTKRFVLYKPQKGGKTPADSSRVVFRKGEYWGDYADKTEAQIDLEFRQAEYIATKEEKKIYRSLDLDGKRKFMARFWKKRDSNPATEVNEFKQEYLERVAYANLNFKGLKKAGWQTDQGRVLLIYGRPDDVERHYMEVDTKPYEIWRYDQLEGGVIFVFADLNGFGEFELVHSTYSQELSNPNWRNLVRRSSAGSGFDF